jgi:DNA cross-link repair 1B protein
VFFLTHCHEDHLKGLTPSWNYGTIYASATSRRLITDRYPNLVPLVVELELDQEHWIYCDGETKKEGVSVMLMDACHCPGAVMLLFRGKMGTVLHTGDFRFSPTMFENPILFPPGRRNAEERGIAVDVDTLMLDNTFADATYDFPSREEAYLQLKKIVDSHLDYRIFVFSYFLGKEEVFGRGLRDPHSGR